MTTKTETEKEIIARLDIGKVYKFNKCDKGIYYYDIEEYEVFDVTVQLVSNYGAE